MMSDFIERMKVERDELSDRLNKLHAYIDSPQFDEIGKLPQSLLIKQSAHMQSYLDVLNKRIYMMPAGING